MAVVVVEATCKKPQLRTLRYQPQELYFLKTGDEGQGMNCSTKTGKNAEAVLYTTKTLHQRSIQFCSEVQDQSLIPR